METMFFLEQTDVAWKSWISTRESAECLHGRMSRILPASPMHWKKSPSIGSQFPLRIYHLKQEDCTSCVQSGKIPPSMHKLKAFTTNGKPELPSKWKLPLLVVKRLYKSDPSYPSCSALPHRLARIVAALMLH